VRAPNRSTTASSASAAESGVRRIDEAVM
jgi:hypothetical protein